MSPSADTLIALDGHRTAAINPLLSPAMLRHEHPMTAEIADTVLAGRASAVDILDGRDDRLLVVVGPCSVHDADAALDYARRLAAKAEEHRRDLHIVMRVYFEKPRTTLGWKGLINDPGLDGTYEVNHGLRMARKLLLDISALGLPVGCEFLDPITPQFISDTVTWGSIGARTAASQVHRQLCSALSMPVGIKNSTEGRRPGRRRRHPRGRRQPRLRGDQPDGLAALITTAGNEDCHVILRGSSAGPNYDPATVADTLARLAKSGLPERVIIDASHGNSAKDHVRQATVVRELAGRIGAGERGIAGLMLESFLVEGRQDLTLGSAASLTYGQSITDACLGWDTTAELLDTLAEAVDSRR